MHFGYLLNSKFVINIGTHSLILFSVFVEMARLVCLRSWFCYLSLSLLVWHTSFLVVFSPSLDQILTRNPFQVKGELMDTVLMSTTTARSNSMLSSPSNINSSHQSYYELKCSRCLKQNFSVCLFVDFIQLVLSSYDYNYQFNYQIKKKIMIVQ